MRFYRLTMLLVFSLLALPATPLRAEIIDIDNAALERLRQQGVPVVDIRTEAEWRDTGIVPGSHLLTLFDASGRADPERWLAQLSRIAKPEQPLILICRSGNRTRTAARLLDKQGYRTIHNVQHGIQAWQAERRPLQAAGAAITACQSLNRC